MTRVLLVARPGRARDRFLEELDALGASAEVAAGPADLLAATRLGRYSGVLFDVPTLIREKNFDKLLLRDLASVYPSVRLKYDAAADTVHALGTNAAPTGRDGLSVFVEACREVSPRAMRRGGRVPAHLPVVLRRGEPPAGDGEQAVTLNISSWGCFVVTAAPFTEGEPVTATFPDIAGCRVRGRITWVEPWGARRELPGVGLAFLEMPETLATALTELGCAPGHEEVASSWKGP